MADAGGKRRLPILNNELDAMLLELQRQELELAKLARDFPTRPASNAELLEMYAMFRTFGPPSPVFYHDGLRPIDMLPWEPPEDAAAENRPVRPTLPASTLKLQINLVPGGARRAPVEVTMRKQRGELTKEAVAELKARVGDDVWPTFIRRWREVYYGLNKAAAEVDGLRDAITVDDFARWSSSAVNQLAALDARIDDFAPDLERVSALFLAAVRAQVSTLKAYFALLTRMSTFRADPMLVTGEYER